MGEIGTDKKIKDSFLRIRRDIEENAKHIAELEQENLKLQEQVRMQNSELISKTIKESIKDALEQMNKPRLEKEMLNKLNRKKREIIKHKILDVIGTRQLSVGELKEYVVDERGYCSKATFYRYLDELRKKNLVHTIVIDDSRMVALSSGLKIIK